MLSTTTLLCLATLLSLSTSYELVHDYSGTTFFDRWDFYGSWDNLTLGVLARIIPIIPFFIFLTPLITGDVWWLDRASAFRENLAYINEHDRVIIKVDNVTSVPFNEKRNSVIVTPLLRSDLLQKLCQIRITSQDWYAVGSLWIIDLIHLPYGCSVPLCIDSFPSTG